VKVAHASVLLILHLGARTRIHTLKGSQSLPVSLQKSEDCRVDCFFLASAGIDSCLEMAKPRSPPARQRLNDIVVTGKQGPRWKIRLYMVGENPVWMIEVGGGIVILWEPNRPPLDDNLIEYGQEADLICWATVEEATQVAIYDWNSGLVNTKLGPEYSAQSSTDVKSKESCFAHCFV